MYEQYVDKPIADATQWYFDKRARKKWLGLAIRLAAILAAGVGALVPLLSSLVSRGTGGAPWIEGGWSGVAILVAGGLIWMDRFLGGTSGWLRYITTGLKAAELRDQFGLEWSQHECSLQNPPTGDDMVRSFELIRTQNGKIHELIQQETDKWVAEFRTSIQELDNAMKERVEQVQRTAAERAAVELASLNVTVKNGTKSTVQLERDGHAPRKREGPNAAFTALEPGHWRVVVAGKTTVNGNECEARAERTIDLKPGAIVTEEIELQAA